jgi:hypothetical protein
LRAIWDSRSSRGIDPSVAEIRCRYPSRLLI